MSKDNSGEIPVGVISPSKTPKINIADAERMIANGHWPSPPKSPKTPESENKTINPDLIELVQNCLSPTVGQFNLSHIGDESQWLEPFKEMVASLEKTIKPGNHSNIWEKFGKDKEKYYINFSSTEPNNDNRYSIAITSYCRYQRNGAKTGVRTEETIGQTGYYVKYSVRGEKRYDPVTKEQIKDPSLASLHIDINNGLSVYAQLIENKDQQDNKRTRINIPVDQQKKITGYFSELGLENAVNNLGSDI